MSEVRRPRSREVSAPVSRAPDLIRSQVANYLRNAIASGRLRPGQVLAERKICEETTASRASVREALRELEANGLVVSAPGRGTVVTELTEKAACQCYEVRAALEGLAGWMFALNATDEELARLTAVVEEMTTLVDSPVELLDAKSEFYDILFLGAGNPELRRSLDLLHLRVTMARAKSLARPGRPEESVAELRGILAAALRRDPEQVSRLCVEHVCNAAGAALGESAAAGICAPVLTSREGLDLHRDAATEKE